MSFIKKLCNSILLIKNSQSRKLRIINSVEKNVNSYSLAVQIQINFRKADSFVQLNYFTMIIIIIYHFVYFIFPSHCTDRVKHVKG